MKNFEMLTMINGGILNLTAYELDVAHAYKLVKFKNQMKAAQAKYTESYNSLVTEVGIEDGNTFDARMRELSKKEKLTKAEIEELDGMNAKLTRLTAMRNALDDEEVVLDGVKTMPYEQWFLLQKENKDLNMNFGDTSVALLTLAEPVLEGVLWAAPED